MATLKHRLLTTNSRQDGTARILPLLAILLVIAIGALAAPQQQQYRPSQSLAKLPGGEGCEPFHPAVKSW